MNNKQFQHGFILGVFVTTIIFLIWGILNLSV